MLPADGVYVGYLAGASDSALPDRAPCVVNIGHRPTVSGKGRQVEAHVLDFSGDLYAQELRLEFVKRLRDEARYESLDELQRQIDRDVTQARRVLGSVPERAG